jgi:hypothetical protein
MLVVLHPHLPLHYASGKQTKQAMLFQLSHEYVRLKSVQLPVNVVWRFVSSSQPITLAPSLQRLHPRFRMIRLIIGVEVNNSSGLYALFPTNTPNCWESQQFNLCILVLVVKHVACLGHKKRSIHGAGPETSRQPLITDVYKYVVECP